jgi:hypothetical protein
MSRSREATELIQQTPCRLGTRVFTDTELDASMLVGRHDDGVDERRSASSRSRDQPPRRVRRPRSLPADRGVARTIASRRARRRRSAAWRAGPARGRRPLEAAASRRCRRAGLFREDADLRSSAAQRSSPTSAVRYAGEHVAARPASYGNARQRACAEGVNDVLRAEQDGHMRRELRGPSLRLETLRSTAGRPRDYG